MATTWNPADKTGAVVLSNGNLTADGDTGGGGVRSTASQNTGKIYFEMTMTGSNFSVATVSGMGIATATAAINVNWGAAGHVGPKLSSGNIFVGTTNTGLSLGLINPGSSFCVAVDMTAKLAWFRIDNGNWNASGTNNPATGVGGIDISSIFAAVPAYAATYVQSSFAINTINFGGTAFSQTAPSGFTAWDAPAAPVETPAPPRAGSSSAGGGKAWAQYTKEQKKKRKELGLEEEDEEELGPDPHEQRLQQLRLGAMARKVRIGRQGYD